MSTRSSKVIGYFAYTSRTEVVCTGTACVISGSRRAMQQYLLEVYPDQKDSNTTRAIASNSFEK